MFVQEAFYKYYPYIQRAVEAFLSIFDDSSNADEDEQEEAVWAFANGLSEAGFFKRVYYEYLDSLSWWDAILAGLSLTFLLASFFATGGAVIILMSAILAVTFTQRLTSVIYAVRDFNACRSNLPGRRLEDDKQAPLMQLSAPQKKSVMEENTEVKRKDLALKSTA